MNSNKKIHGDNFGDIRQSIIAGGLNIRQWSKQRGFPASTVNFALAGFPRSARSAMIRAEARKAIELLKTQSTQNLKQ